MDILQFTPQTDRGQPLEILGEAFEALAAGIVAEHKGEAAKAELARQLLRVGFEKCITCQAEGRQVNIALIELCPHDDCPLHYFFPRFAGAVMVATGEKTPGA
jgi:hypothetical protein